MDAKGPDGAANPWCMSSMRFFRMCVSHYVGILLQESQEILLIEAALWLFVRRRQNACSPKLLRDLKDSHENRPVARCSWRRWFRDPSLHHHYIIPQRKRLGLAVRNQNLRGLGATAGFPLLVQFPCFVQQDSVCTDTGPRWLLCVT